VCSSKSPAFAGLFLSTFSEETDFADQFDAEFFFDGADHFFKSARGAAGSGHRLFLLSHTVNFLTVSSYEYRL